MDIHSPSPAATLLAARYRDAGMPVPDPWNATLETLLNHRSVRAFLPDPVSDDSLAMIVAAAQSASTSSNVHGFSVVAVRDPARKARLAVLSANQKQIHEAPLFLVWCADLARNADIGAARGTEIEGIHYTESFMVGIVDAALAAQNAAVALASMGLGFCYIGCVRDHPEKMAAELGLPPLVFPLVGMCVGTPDPARPADIKPRLRQSAVLHQEQYSPAPLPAAVAAYDAAYHAFTVEQRMPPMVWSDKIVDRLRNAAALRGRDRMRDALAALGFELR